MALGVPILKHFRVPQFTAIKSSKYSRTSLARTPLEPWKYIPDKDSSS